MNARQGSIIGESLKIGVVCSTNGSALIAFNEICKSLSLGIKLFVVVDRDCGIEEYCNSNSISIVKIRNTDNRAFSISAGEYLVEKCDVNFVVLFFHRLITEELYEKVPTYNIHPALLPSFKGFNAESQALAAGVKFFGTTLHRVDMTIDGGEIIAQCIEPLHESYDLNVIKSKTYEHKVYLSLLLIDIHLSPIEIGNNFFDEAEYSLHSKYGNFNPRISSMRLIKAYDKFMRER